MAHILLRATTTRLLSLSQGGQNSKHLLLYYWSALTLSRHVLDDYTYTGDYLQKWVIKSAGGAGMEFHEFAHLDCPLDSIRESGYYVLAKWTDDSRTALEITAFKV